MAEPLQLMPSSLVADLQRLLAPERVSDSPDNLERFAGDALAAYRAFGRAKRVEVPPLVVATPKDTEEVSALVTYASRHGIPIIPRGGGTGVMGGAVPVDGSIVLNLRSLDTIHQIDREGHQVTVGAGAILEDLENALIPQGLLLGHDPWSRPIATVGGAISTNGMGYLAGKYGSMGQQVQGLEVVLGTGDVIQTPSVPKIAGPDLDNIFIGAEGAMGIITKATLEAFPQPEVRSLHAFRFASFAPGFNARLSPMLPVSRQQHFRSLLVKAGVVYVTAVSIILIVRLAVSALQPMWQGITAAIGTGLTAIPMASPKMSPITSVMEVYDNHAPHRISRTWGSAA